VALGRKGVTKDATESMPIPMDRLSLRERNPMRMKLFSAAALALALAGFGPRVAEAEIIWSGVQNISAISTTSPKDFNGGAWKWGIVQGGPVSYAFFTPRTRADPPTCRMS
jgi:hypothetical protein